MTGAIKTVHLVYPHGPRISTPDAIGRNVGERLERRYDVIYHDWDGRYSIAPATDAALVGHPHPVPGTAFRRSCRAPGWGRVLMMAPFNDDPAQVAFEDQLIRHCDLFLAISGPFWFSRLATSPFSHWAPKMRRLDLAIDPTDYPRLKASFNPSGRRRFVYIGHGSRMKNTSYLSDIARLLPNTEVAWIGPGSKRLKGVTKLGVLDFSTELARTTLAGFDFLVTVGKADANPTTVLEAMAWGLLPVCTPQSGYVGLPGITNIPLADAPAAAAILRGLQSEPDAALRRRQEANWEAVAQHYTWDRFAAQVVDAIESTSVGHLHRASAARRVQLAWATWSSYHTSPIRFWGRRLTSRARSSFGTPAGAKREQ